LSLFLSSHLGLLIDEGEAEFLYEQVVEQEGMILSKHLKMFVETFPDDF
jgi:hypothetical protein